MPQIVIVDSEPERLDAAVAAARAALPNIDLSPISEVEGAVEFVRASSPDLLVVHAGTSGARGAAGVLLGGAAYQRRAKALLLTDDGVELGGVEADCLGVRVVASGVAGLGDALSDELSAAEADSLASLHPARFLQVARLTEWSGVLSVRDARRSGTIEVAAGKVCGARFQDTEGAEALQAILNLIGGTLAARRREDVDASAIDGADRLVDEAVVLWKDGGPDDAIEITEDDLVAFMGDEPATEMDAFQLFSPEELSELALDDAMAIPVGRPKPPTARED